MIDDVKRPCLSIAKGFSVQVVSLLQIAKCTYRTGVIHCLMLCLCLRSLKLKSSIKLSCIYLHLYYFIANLFCSLQTLERKILSSSKDTPDEVHEVKTKVEALREKLEVDDFYVLGS